MKKKKRQIDKKNIEKRKVDELIVEEREEQRK